MNVVYPFFLQKERVWLSGDPIFSLDYTDEGFTMRSDLLSYRPDPLDVLEQGKKYRATLIFVEINTWEGKKGKSLKSIIIKDKGKVYTLSKIR